MKLFLICFATLTFLISCIGPVALQHSLNEYKAPLRYAFDSQLDTLKSDCKIYLHIIDKLDLNDTTKVIEDGFLVVPLIIAGGYKYDFTVTLGKKSVQPSFSEFIYDSFVKEATRSGNFFVQKQTFRSDYIIEMTLLNCTTSTQYHKDRIRYGQNYRENWILKPITGTFSIEVRLLQKNKVVFSHIYKSTKSSQLEIQEFESGTEMNSIMMEEFAKTVSLQIKEIVESSIQDINKQIL